MTTGDGERTVDEEKTMRAMRILEALSGVDEALLDRTYRDGETASVRQFEGKKMALLWRWSRPWAAVLCLALVGALGWGGYRMVQDKGYGDMSLRNATGLSGGMNMADGVQTEGVNAELAPQEQKGEAAEDLQKAMDSMEKYGVESAGVEADTESAAMSAEAGAATNGGLQTDSGWKAPAAEQLTEAQARSREGLGSYIPSVLPQGYAFFDAVYDADSGVLTVFWERGMDSILVSVRAADGVAAVDVERPEAYDMRLYEVPYGESVPREYWESFQDPVFASEDLSLEIVKSRMISYQDAGDTDTPRGMFGILYPDGILVRFNGRGTAEEIWEMFRTP